jgi:hypothetical protein
MNTDIYYLLGALRDASFDIRTSKNYELKIHQDYLPWLSTIERILTDNFNCHCRIKNSMLRANGREVMEELLLISGFQSPQLNWGTPEILKDANAEDIWWYISGFWDAEGGVPYSTKWNYTSFDQKSKSALDFVRSFLVSENLRPTNLTYTGKVWQCRITRKEHLKLFALKLHSFHEEKFQRLLSLIATFP